MEIAQIKYPIIILIKAIIILFAFLFILSKFKGCGNNELLNVKSETKSNLLDSIIILKNNETTKLLSHIKTIEGKVDSLTKLKTKIKSGLKTKYDSAIVNSPDTCDKAVTEIYNWCAKVDSVNSLVIAKQDSILNDYRQIVANNTDVVTLKDYQLSQKTDSINSLKLENKLLKKSVRNEKLKGWGKSIISGLAGFGLGKIIP